MLIAPSDEPHGHVCNSSCALLSPPPLNSNQWALLQPGHLSEQADRASETATEDLAPRPRYSQPAEARFTGLAGVALFMDEEMRKKEKDGEREGKRESILFFLTSVPLPVNLTLHTSLSALLSSSQPIQSHFNLPVNVRRMPRPITSLMLFIKATGCELPCP